MTIVELVKLFAEPLDLAVVVLNSFAETRGCARTVEAKFYWLCVVLLVEVLEA